MNEYSNEVGKNENELAKSATIYSGKEYIDGKRVRRELNPIVERVREEFRVCSLNPRYLISNYGRVYDRSCGHIMTPSTKGDTVNPHTLISINGYGTQYISALVANEFMQQPDETYKLRHKNGRRSINTTENLYYTNKPIPRNPDDRTIVKSQNRENMHSVNEIHRICQLIIQGLDDLRIAAIIQQEFNHEGYSAGYIKYIRYCNDESRPEWAIISQYKNQFPNRNRQLFDNNTVRNMAMLMSQGYTPSYIAQALGIEDNKQFRGVLTRLRNGSAFKEIGSGFEFKY